MMTFFVRPIIRPPANLYKNDGGGGGGEGGGPKFVYPEMAIISLKIDRGRKFAYPEFTLSLK